MSFQSLDCENAGSQTESAMPLGDAFHRDGQFAVGTATADPFTVGGKLPRFAIAVERHEHRDGA